MLSSVLAAVTCAAIPVTDPLQISAQMPPQEACVEVGSYVTPTSFRSRNFSDVDQLLMFGDPNVSSPRPCIVTLPPGGIVQYEFAAQALEGVLLEVVSTRGGVLTTSGQHPLALPTTSEDMTLWTVPAASGLATWQQLGCEVTLLSSQGSFLPEGSTGSGSGAEAATAPPIAVPVDPSRLPPPSTQSPYTPM